jgi:hypothetical protein
MTVGSQRVVEFQQLTTTATADAVNLGAVDHNIAITCR